MTQTTTQTTELSDKCKDPLTERVEGVLVPAIEEQLRELSTSKESWTKGIPATIKEYIAKHSGKAFGYFVEAFANLAGEYVYRDEVAVIMRKYA